LGGHLNQRDVRAVRKTVSGLIKLLHPDGRFTRDELQEYLEIALEGRRRVKEQLKFSDQVNAAFRAMGLE